MAEARRDENAASRRVIGVSACMLGERVRYDGRPLGVRLELDPDAFDVVAVCPEVAAGMPVPRPAMELTAPAADVLDAGGGVLDAEGRDVRARLLEGCSSCLRELEEAGVRMLVLKERSPSCGVDATPQGPGGELGPGVFAEMARRRGWLVIGSGALEGAHDASEVLARLLTEADEAARSERG